MSLAVGLLVSGCGGSHPTRAVPAVGGGESGAVHATTLSAIRSDDMLQVGTRVLVAADGYALYMFVPDDQRAVTCVGLCAVSWPPAYQNGTTAAHAASGVQPGLVGSDTDPDGRRVVTYNHWPLYTYAADPQPGYAAGQGINLDGGYWYLMRPDGSPLVPPGEPAATGRPPT